MKTDSVVIGCWNIKYIETKKKEEYETVKKYERDDETHDTMYSNELHCLVSGNEG